MYTQFVWRDSQQERTQEREPSFITMEHVHSAITDDSPFGSSLTTPVDEIDGFHGVENRFGVKENAGVASGLRIAVDADEGRFPATISHSLSKAVRQSQEFSSGLEEKVCTVTRVPFTHENYFIS